MSWVIAYAWELLGALTAVYAAAVIIAYEIDKRKQ